MKEVSSSSWEFDMTDRLYLRTRDLALAGGISVQQVREEFFAGTSDVERFAQARSCQCS